MKPVMAHWRQAGFIALALLAGIALLATTAVAQPATREPQTLTFDVAPDHATVDADGPRVIKYIVEFLPVDGGKPRTLDLGKPEAPNGSIAVPLAEAKLPDGEYLAAVRVIGATSSTVSATVGPFQIGKPRRAKSSGGATPPPPVTAAPDRAPTPADPPPSSSSPDAQKRRFWKRIYGVIVG
jgi:hypothetical protein